VRVIVTALRGEVAILTRCCTWLRLRRLIDGREHFCERIVEQHASHEVIINAAKEIKHKSM
jgi:hypothetical protein